MRLVGGYQDVILARAHDSIDEHAQIADAILSLCDANRNTEERLRELLKDHMTRAEEELISVLLRNFPDRCSSTRQFATPRLDMICNLAH